ncbi:hypothetical protein [Akkermansia sp.]|uniref:hypothetical protein n=1 Tax=Akkermansia sp. TaxID=1872421 RepID=UPI003AAA7A08
MVTACYHIRKKNACDFTGKMRELPASADKMERSGKTPPELPAFTGIQQTVPEYFMFDGQRNGRNHPLTGGIFYQAILINLF